MIETYPGYLVAVFIHDNRILSALIARASADRQLAALRTRAAFDAATGAVPALAAWTDPGRSRPITPVLPGGRLYNSYQGQLNGTGRVALDGLIYAGDSVCTTNPAAGRGVTTSLQQARQLIGLLEEHGRDFTSCSIAFDHWCAGNIKPWFDDHVYWDADLIRRWSGRDVDLTRPLPPDLIMAAAQADPEMIKVVGPYQAMLALPSSLDAVQARARDIYASGWHPPKPQFFLRGFQQGFAFGGTLGRPARDCGSRSAARRDIWRKRDLAYGLIIARAVAPASKLATTRWWVDTTLGADLGISDATTDEVYAAMDWAAVPPGRDRE